MIKTIVPQSLFDKVAEIEGFDYANRTLMVQKKMPKLKIPTKLPKH